MFHSLIFNHMFLLPLPILEKRELGQLNPFDLVVLLSLSNTVQNAIIGEDNSVTGGVIGAFSLLAINWLVVRLLFRSRRLTRVFEGRATVLVRDGQIDQRALKHESLTREELIEVIHRQGFEDVDQVRCCELEPNGSYSVEAFDPSAADKRHAELLAHIDALTRDVAALKAQAAGE
jgi:uncharacterized membrane protein YcaP (DUF421 family)